MKIFLRSLIIVLTMALPFSGSAITQMSNGGTFEATYSTDCAPVTVSFTNFGYPGASSYNWWFGDGNGSSVANPNNTFSTAGYYTIWLDFYDASGFYLYSDYVNLELNGDPNGIYSYQTAACPGDRCDFQLQTGTYQSTSYTYVWDFGDGTIETTNYTNVQHVYSSAGNYTITCNVTGPCGSYVESIPFTVGNNIPFSGGYFDVYPSEVCPGDEVYFYYTGASYQYIQFGDGQSSLTSYYHTYAQTGTYIAKATLMNGCGNSAVLYDTVYVLPNLGIDPNSVYVYNSSPICPGQEVSFNTSSQFSSVLWEFSDGTSTSNYWADHTFNTNQNDTVMVTLTNGCGADTTISTIVEISTSLPATQIDLTMPSAACPGAPVSFSANDMDGGSNGYNYYWNFGDGTNSTATSGYHAFATAGTYNVTLTAVNSCGEDSTQTTQVTVAAGTPPDPNYTFLFSAPEGEACIGDSILLIVFPYVPGTYSFDFGDGNTAVGTDTVVVFGRTYLMVKHAYVATGNYTINMTYTNACNLSINKSLPYLVGSNVESNGEFLFDDEAQICLGDPIPFSAFGGVEFEWDFGDGSGTLITTNTFTPIYHTYQNPGVYTVNMIARNGCGNYNIQTEDVVVPDNRIDITTNTVDSHCGENDGTAIAVISGGNSPYQVTWSSGDNSILVNDLSSGIYIVNVTDANGCYNFGIATVSDAEAPTIVINNVIDVSCFGGTDGAIDINVIGNTGPYTFNWSNGETSEDVGNLVAGPYEVVVTDANGCVAVASINVDQPEGFQVSFTTNEANCGASNGSIVVNANGTTGPYIYVWSQGGITGPVLNNIGIGIYEVNVIDQLGCIVTENVALSEMNANGGPVVTINSVTPLDCNGAGSTISTSVFSGIAPIQYVWNTGDNTPAITVNQTGTYAVLVTDSTGCKATAIVEITHGAPEGQTICMVTVDSVYSVNKVAWEKEFTTNIDYYKIYRESSQNGLYYHVGSVPYDSLSEFIDYVANPMTTAWRYRMSTVDYCGTESELSTSHKTIHLNQNIGLGGTVNLIWDHYEGFSYSTYDIIRYTDTDGWQVIGTVSSANTSFTDASPPSDSSLFYVVSASPDVPCISTRAVNNNSTRSNRTQNPVAPPGSTSTNEIIGAIEGMAIFPNPNNGTFTVQADFIKEENANLMIYSVEGKLIHCFQFTGSAGRNDRVIQLTDIPAGIYFVKLQSESSSFVKKVVVE